MTAIKRLRALLNRLTRLIRRMIGRRPTEPRFDEFSSYDAYLDHVERYRTIWIERERITHDWSQLGDSFHISGYCDPCERRVDFLVDFLYAPSLSERREPNWRERVVCPCGLNNRVRAAVHVFRRFCRPTRSDPIYITEQVTPLYRWLTEEYESVVGSEYQGDTVPFGSTRQDGIRNESITHLSFADAAFAHALSFDVIEHVPDYEMALRELSRVLRPGGTLLFSVPFLANAQHTLTRARITCEGEIEHLLPPEYHGDPMAEEGCLCFYHFGWDLLESARRAGFSDVRAIAVWSREFGYLGGEQLLFLARR